MAIKQIGQLGFADGLIGRRLGTNAMLERIDHIQQAVKEAFMLGLLRTLLRRLCRRNGDLLAGRRVDHGVILCGIDAHGCLTKQAARHNFSASLLDFHARSAGRGRQDLPS